MTALPWMALSVWLCAAALGAPPPPGTPASGSPADGTAAAPPGAPATVAPAAAPGEDLLEFLGADDVGDAAWWDFLKESPLRPEPPPDTPPQDVQSW